MNTPTTTLQARLRKLRGAMTRHEFAALIGASVSSIVKYEKGERLPHSEILSNIALSCGVSGEWLLFGGARPQFASATSADISTPRCIFCGNDEETLRQRGHLLLRYAVCVVGGGIDPHTPAPHTCGRCLDECQRAMEPYRNRAREI